MFQQDNAPAHKSVVAMADVRDCGFELIDHPAPYSPDLTPSDYFLFLNMKTHSVEKQYPTDDEVISAVADFFEDQDESFYTTGIQALQHRWKKCVDRRGDYIEKIWSNSTIAAESAYEFSAHPRMFKMLIYKVSHAFVVSWPYTLAMSVIDEHNQLVDFCYNFDR